MTIKRVALILCAGVILSLSMPPIYAQEGKQIKKPAINGDSTKLLGVWEIFQTKEPGKPYRQAYKGRSFVSRGVHAFTLILEYRDDDGTFRRVSRIGNDEKVQDGKWRFSGSELRHKRNGAYDEEIMYVRFDDPNQYTSIEVFEDTHDPGLFAQFKRQH